MKAVYGLYKTPVAAQRAFDGLRSAGLSQDAITVLSSEPFEEWDFGSQDRKSIMPWIAILGAIAGLAVAYLLTSWTQKAWPINTGGMPIVTNWTNTIILFELTMLGAVLATVFALLITARLLRKPPALYDPAISEGKILVGVSSPASSQLSGIEHALRAANPETVKQSA